MQLVNVARRAKLGYVTKKGFDDSLSKLNEAKEYHSKVSALLKGEKEYLGFHKANYLNGVLSILEAYMSDTLFEFLVCYPGHANEKNLSLNSIDQAGSIAEVVKSSAQRKINSLAYKKFSEFHGDFCGILSLEKKVDDELVKQISEIKATRDIYVHANGVCNDIYIQKSGDIARKKVGEKLPLDDGYIEGFEEKIEKYIKEIYSGIPERIKGYGRLKAFKEMWDASGFSTLRPFDDFWISDDDKDMARPKQELFDFGWSSSEKAAVDFFLGIYSQDHPERKTDLMYALMKWPPSTNMGRVMVSWAESPFWF